MSVRTVGRGRIASGVLTLSVTGVRRRHVRAPTNREGQLEQALVALRSMFREPQKLQQLRHSQALSLGAGLPPVACGFHRLTQQREQVVRDAACDAVAVVGAVQVTVMPEHGAIREFC